nr:MFS transporter [uncultured Pseudomonas sp.]
MTTAFNVVVARTLVSAVVFDALVPLSPFIAQDMGMTPAYFQSVLALCLTVFAVGQLISTSLINRIGASRSLATGSTLAACSCISGVLASNGLALSIAFISMFAANALATTASRVWLRQHLGPTKFQTVTAYLYGGISTLATLSPVILMLSASVWGWRYAFGSLGVALLIFSLALLPRPLQEPISPSSSKASGPLWKQPTFISALLMGVLIQSSFTQLNLSKAFILDGVFLLSTTTISVILSAWAMLIALAFFAAGKSVTRFTQTVRLKAGLFAQGLGAIGMGVAWYQVDLTLYLLAAAATSIAFCTLLPLTTAWALGVVPSQQASASAILGSTTVAAAGLTSWLAAQMHTSLLFTLMIVLGACALGSLLMRRVLPTQGNAP